MNRGEAMKDMATCYRATMSAAREIRRASRVVSKLPKPVGAPLRKRSRALRVSAMRTLRVLRGARSSAPPDTTIGQVERRVDLLSRCAHDLHAEAVFLSAGPSTTSVEALAETAARAVEALGLGGKGRARIA